MQANQKIDDAQKWTGIAQKAVGQLRNEEKLCFDPQGSCTVRVKGEDETFTMVTVDVMQIPDLRDKFEKWLNKDNEDLFSAFEKSESKHSIISLQDEMEKNIRLFARVLQKIENPTGSRCEDAKREATIKKALQTMNKEVKSVTQKAFKEGLNDGTLDISVINTHLENARKDLPKRCKTAFLKSLKEEKPFSSNRDFYNDIIKKISNEHFKSTTALECNELILDSQTGLITLITGTSNTSHNKREGADTVASRHIIQKKLTIENDEIKITELKKNARRVRLPSPIVNHKNKKKQISDTLSKFKHLKKDTFDRKIDETKPIVYHLLTSLHSKWYEIFFDRKNRQRGSANIILQASHQMNAKNNSDTNYVLVQNIGVNQHGISLNSSKDSVCQEATLMSDFSLLYTLSTTLSSEKALEQNYNGVNSRYKTFLSALSDNNHYFFKTESKNSATQNAIYFIQEAKKAFSPKEEEENKTMDFRQSVGYALWKLYSENTHYNKQYGMLVQALSTYLTTVSYDGCKSGCERTMHLLGRVELLTSIENNDTSRLSTTEKTLIDTLKEFVKGEKKASDLQKALDEAYNHKNLYGANKVIPSSCLGITAKISAETRGNNDGCIRSYNTNVGETESLRFLKSQYVKKCQPHTFNHAKQTKTLIKEIIIKTSNNTQATFCKEPTLKEEVLPTENSAKPAPTQSHTRVSTAYASVRKNYISLNSGYKCCFYTLFKTINRKKKNQKEAPDSTREPSISSRM